MKRFLCTLLVVAYVQVPTARGATPQMTYHIETVAGSALTGDGGSAIAAQLSTIQGVAADHLGNLYISDTDNQRVRKISSTGVISTLAGTGTAGYSGDGGPATAAQVNSPYGIAVDLAGNVYVADTFNNCVRRIGIDGTIATVAGTGRKGASLDGGAATDAALMTPRNVAVDGAGNLFISEFEGHRVRKVTPDGRISTVAGIGEAGLAGDNGLAVNAQLNAPAGLALDRMGVLYIADSGNLRVRKIKADGNIVTALDGSLSNLGLTPLAVAVDVSGDICVAGFNEVMVRCYTPAGVWITLAGNGLGFGGDGGLASSALLSAAPHDLAWDFAGNLFIADGLRVRRVDGRMDGNARIQTVAGDGNVNIGDGGAATGGVLSQPSAVALGNGGILYIADTRSQRIRRVTASGAISTFAGTGIGGASKDGVAAVAANLYSPMGVAADGAGNILIADTANSRIRQVAADGVIRTVAGTGGAGTGAEGLPPLQMPVGNPQAVCLDHSGTMYIADTDHNRILRAPLNGVVTTVAGNGSIGAAGDGGLARLAELHFPSGCAFDSAGNLFIADTLGHRIRRVTPGGIITTVAGTGDAVFGGDEGAATAAQLSGPRAVAVDDNGNIFIADTENHRIRQITPDGVIHTIAGQNGAGFAGDGGPSTSSRLNRPGGLFLDAMGTLYVADTNNNRVRRMVPDSVLPPDPVVAPQVLTAVSAASQIKGPVAPGEIVSIFGSGIGPVTAVPGTFDSAGLLANLLGGAEVRFDGVPAPLFYAQSAQINAQVPYTVAGASLTHIEVFYQGHSAGTLDLPVAAAAPGIFSIAINQDGSTNSQSSPAPRGSILTFFATGEGLTDGANISGQPAGAPYPRPVLGVSLIIAGINAELLYAGAVPGGVGVLQVNARVPAGFVPPGPAAVALTLGNFAAPAAAFWLK